MSDGSSDDDGDYAADNAGIPGSSSSAVGVPSMRYPVHDFAEFEDAETLRVSPWRPLKLMAMVDRHLEASLDADVVAF